MWLDFVMYAAIVLIVIIILYMVLPDRKKNRFDEWKERPNKRFRE